MPGPPAASPVISVCIVTGRRPALLDRCLESLQDQQEAPSFELLVCADADRHVEAVVRDRFPDATVLHVPKTLPSAGRNQLIDHARGELLLWLDDDITFGPHLLRDLGSLAAQHPEIAVFGGPNETPPESSRFQWVQGAVLASMIASGPVRRRYGAHPAGEADERWFILCNLAVRRATMTQFDDDLVCAEENALLAELHDSGARMLYDPRLAVFHERRGDVTGFVRQMYKYGRGRGQLSRRTPSSLRPQFLAPSVVVVYLCMLPALALWTPWALVPAGAYLGAIAAGAAKVAVTLRRWSTWPTAAWMILAVHLCYGTGVLRGLLEPGPDVRRDLAGPRSTHQVR
jgi:succinoglycan biosynthesis protein ExoA